MSLQEIKMNILNCIEEQKENYTSMEYKFMVESLSKLDNVNNLENKVKALESMNKGLKEKQKDLNSKIRKFESKYLKMCVKYAENN